MYSSCPLVRVIMRADICKNRSLGTRIRKTNVIPLVRLLAKLPCRSAIDFCRFISITAPRGILSVRHSSLSSSALPLPRRLHPHSSVMHQIGQQNNKRASGHPFCVSRTHGWVYKCLTLHTSAPAARYMGSHPQITWHCLGKACTEVDGTGTCVCIYNRQ